MITLYWNSQLEQGIDPFKKVVGVQINGHRPHELHIDKEGIKGLLDSTPEELYSYLNHLQHALS